MRRTLPLTDCCRRALSENRTATGGAHATLVRRADRRPWSRDFVRGECAGCGHDEVPAGWVGGCDPPPVKWSTLSYGFCSKEDRDAEKELQAGGDRRQA